MSLFLGSAQGIKRFRIRFCESLEQFADARSEAAYNSLFIRASVWKPTTPGFLVGRC